MTADREIRVSRVINAPRERVFEAMVDSKQVVKWWGPRGFSTTIHEMDVRPGGVWRQTMHGPDGVDYDNRSTFIEIVKPERIVFKHGGSKPGDKGVSFHATWTFEAQGNKTKITLHSLFPSKEDRDRVVRDYNAEEGGKQTLERLSRYMEAKPALELPLVLERVYSAPVERVWKALTDKKEMKKWYFDLPAFKPEVGTEFEFTASKDDVKYRHLCKVTEVVPDRKITYSWRYDGYEGISFVTFELFRESGKTRLKLTHAGLETFPKSNPDLAPENFQNGWTFILGESLKKYLGE